MPEELKPLTIEEVDTFGGWLETMWEWGESKRDYPVEPRVSRRLIADWRRMRAAMEAIDRSDSGVIGDIARKALGFLPSA